MRVAARLLWNVVADFISLIPFTVRDAANQCAWAYRRAHRMAIFRLRRTGLLHAKRAWRGGGITIAVASAGGSWTCNGVFTFGPNSALPRARVGVEKAAGWQTTGLHSAIQHRRGLAIVGGGRRRFETTGIRPVAPRDGGSRTTSDEPIKKKT
jgi:hypothetical protein